MTRKTALPLRFSPRNWVHWRVSPPKLKRGAPAGRALFGRMAAVHARWVIELPSGLNATEKSQVYRLLAKLKLHLVSAAQGQT